MKIGSTHLLAAAAAALLTAICCLVPPGDPAHAQAGAVGVADGEILIAGSAGDLQNTQNLIYVVHKRPATEREAKHLRQIDPQYPPHRITLSVYRLEPSGGNGRNGSPGSLHYMRDLTWDEMLRSGSPVVDREQQANQQWLEDYLRRIEGRTR